MTNSKNVYEYEEHDRQPGGTRYFFFSEGEREIILNFTMMKLKQIISQKSKKASNKAVLSDVAARLSNKVLFRDQIEKAKLYLKQATFPTQKG